MNGFKQQANCNSMQPDMDTLVKKKKLMLAQDPEENNNEICGEEFSDLRSVGANGKFSTDEDQPSIYGEVETSIGRSAKDQFADALLRLQSDLHNATERLSDLEKKVDKINMSRGGPPIQESKSKFSVFDRNNVTTLLYFSWPVVVFLAIRAIEKRSASSK